MECLVASSRRRVLGCMCVCVCVRRPGLAAGGSGWPWYRRRADGQPKLVVTLTFAAKTLIPQRKLLQGGLTAIWTRGFAANLSLHTHANGPADRQPETHFLRVINTPRKKEKIRTLGPVLSVAFHSSRQSIQRKSVC